VLTLHHEPENDRCRGGPEGGLRVPSRHGASPGAGEIGSRRRTELTYSPETGSAITLGVNPFAAMRYAGATEPLGSIGNSARGVLSSHALARFPLDTMPATVL
jgi:hypothetical protein